jgi:hypothetical protein
VSVEEASEVALSLLLVVLALPDVMEQSRVSPTSPNSGYPVREKAHDGPVI